MKVSVIIPAYNENDRIERVVFPLLGFVDEIIIVDDGSDYPIKKIEGIKLLRHEINKGKGEALKTGFIEAKNEVIAFFDADLIGLNVKHLKKMEDRLNECNMVIGVFSPTLRSTNIANFVMPSLSGQRIFFKHEASDFFSNVNIKRYGIDRAMYDYYKERSYKIKITVLDDLTQVVKEEKFGFKEGVKLRAKMYKNILKGQ